MEGDRSIDRVGSDGVLIGVGSVEIGVLSDVYGDRVLIASVTFWWGFDQVGSNVLLRLDFDCVGAEIMGLLVYDLMGFFGGHVVWWWFVGVQQQWQV